MYEWDARILHSSRASAEVTIPKQIGALKSSPGLSSFAGGREDQAGDSLVALLEYARSTIYSRSPGVHLDRVPVWLGATAGLRVIPSHSAGKIIQSSLDALRASGFAVPASGAARVLSGEEEGAFGWIAVNAGSDGVPSSPNASYGTLDLGGASSQITFIPKDPSILANLFPMHFGNSLQKGQTIHTYSHSFLHFGFVSSWQRAGDYVSDEVQTFGSQLVVQHPCLASGQNWSVSAPTFGAGFSAQQANRTDGSLDFAGSGNFEACSLVAQAIIPKGTPCFFGGQCSFMGQYQPNLDGLNFALIGDFQAVFHALDVPDGGTLADVAARASEVCGEPEHEQLRRAAQAGYGRATDPPLCWMATWAVTLLSHGYQFPMNTTSLSWHKHDWGGAADWALGRMIYEINSFPVWELEGGEPVLLAEAASQLGSVAMLLPFLLGLLAREVLGRLRSPCHSEEARDFYVVL